MRSMLILLALFLGGILVPAGGPAAAADLGLTRAPANGPRHALPFPRSARAAAVWGENACWEDCQRVCTSGLAGCLAARQSG